ncbi:3-mercaptopyruvate sulfurtransferase [Neorhizobium sp. JUb45]|uniref:3-mercaptopyruvate sulfurtransferase n=1 Tax=unclassified Neorhizobium TaxID=2629175 RepID=UPI0010504CD7|nr:3-mercaptopyruvate sulfurtransferase [Neorhizobium sp. JUb45]TCR03038.1 thiosulfate/3-mercaptopyruvate sulfurtransferase [Neorhizobium sp. JUb45]
MSLSLPGSLVSTEWLASHLDDPDLVILDGSFKLPGATPIAAEDFAARHIPGARFFDIDNVADHDSALPHMLPTAGAFENYAADLGISNDSVVVIYDTPGLMSAGRVWWTLRTFGHDKVAILNGGLRKWQAEGRPVTAQPASVTRGNFKAAFDPAAVRSKAQVLGNLGTQAEQVIDARSAGRFTAEEKEARPGLRSGHIPGSLNLPFNALTNPQTGELLDVSQIRAAFEKAGLDFAAPVIASCGSGVTAAALAFGLHLAGKDDVAIYDGAWTEWGQPGETPVDTGPSASGAAK